MLSSNGTEAVQQLPEDTGIPAVPLYSGRRPTGVSRSVPKQEAPTSSDEGIDFRDRLTEIRKGIAKI